MSAQVTGSAPYRHSCLRYGPEMGREAVDSPSSGSVQQLPDLYTIVRNRTAMTANRLRVGVIGAGVGVLHLSGYAQNPEVEIAALAGLDD